MTRAAAECLYKEVGSEFVHETLCVILVNFLLPTTHAAAECLYVSKGSDSGTL